jgi:dUTP pyrophosphatase
MVPDIRIPVTRVGPVSVPLPAYQSEGAAGMDLHAALDAPLIVEVGARVLVPTGLIFAIPVHYEGQIRPRSGLAVKLGLTVLNAPGTIDSDFRGEVKVLLVNLGTAPATLEPFDRIAQIVFAPVARAELVLDGHIEATRRGKSGYGSTGKT